LLLRMIGTGKSPRKALILYCVPNIPLKHITSIKKSLDAF
jgi:hypothetical protein